MNPFRYTSRTGVDVVAGMGGGHARRVRAVENVETGRAPPLHVHPAPPASVIADLTRNLVRVCHTLFDVDLSGLVRRADEKPHYPIFQHEDKKTRRFLEGVPLGTKN